MYKWTNKKLKKNSDISFDGKSIGETKQPIGLAKARISENKNSAYFPYFDI